MPLLQRVLRHLFGARANDHQRRPCIVHYSNGELRRIDYRYVRHTICTCYPIFMSVSEPPTAPATPPPPQAGGHHV